MPARRFPSSVILFFALSGPLAAAAEDGSESSAAPDPAAGDPAEKAPEKEGQEAKPPGEAEPPGEERPGEGAESAPPPSPPASPPVGTPTATDQEPEEAEARQETDEERARAAYARGDRLYFEGDYQGALEAFEESYALSGRIEMLFNLANAHERLGNYIQAAVALRGYIPHAAEEARPALRKRAERLESLGKTQTQVSAPPPRPEDAKQSIPVSRAVGIGLTGLGVIGLGLGTGFGIAALDQRGKLDDLCETGQDGRLCPPGADPILEKDSTFSTVADISFIVGGVATVAGVYLIIDSRDNGKEVTAHLGPSSVWLRGRF